MDLRLLEIFCHVYQERSFSRAAQSLGLTQPTVSAHVKEFEAAVGTPLLNRLGRDIEPTDAGRFVYEHAEPLLILKRNLADGLAQFLNRIEGDLLVGASSVPGEYLLPGIVSGFQTAHPGVRTLVRISGTATTTDHVRKGELQLGLVGAQIAHADLTFRRFASDTLVLVAAPTDLWADRAQVSLRELRTVPLFIREPGSGTRTALERALAARRLDLTGIRIVSEFGSATAIKHAVIQGHGAAFVSALSIASERAAGMLRVVRVPELDPIRRTYFTVVSRRRVQSPLTQAFLQYLDGRREKTPSPERRPR